jgi:hypothetical protein
MAMAIPFVLLDWPLIGLLINQGRRLALPMLLYAGVTAIARHCLAAAK